MNYIACIKSGNKYNAAYVNTLFSMVKRNMTIDAQFVCFTDDKQGIDRSIETHALPYPGLNGWWNKVSLFGPNLPISGNILFMDLDVLIINNIDPLFHYQANEFIIMENLYQRVNLPGLLNAPRLMLRKFLKRVQNSTLFNSALFRFNSKKQYSIWDKFIQRRAEIERDYPGDQEWISECVGNRAKVWPRNWCMSYKWEIAGDYCNTPPEYYKPQKKQIPEECKVIVFHGKPDPVDVRDDPLVQQHYL